MKFTFGNLVAFAMARRMDAQNSLRRQTRAQFFTSARAITRRLGHEFSGWDIVYAQKVWASLAAGTPILRCSRAMMLVEVITHVFPRVATYYGEVTAIDFTRLPFDFQAGQLIPIHFSIALDLFSRRVRSFGLHRGWPDAKDSIDVLRGG